MLCSFVKAQCLYNVTVILFGIYCVQVINYGFYSKMISHFVLNIIVCFILQMQLHLFDQYFVNMHVYFP